MTGGIIFLYKIMNKLNHSLPVVILCGGKGTRFKEKTVNTPKPLIEIGKKPMLWHIMKIYQVQGFSNFILSCGYKAEKFVHFSKKLDIKCDVKVINTGLNTDTGGRIFKLKKYINTDSFMCTYGDGLSDIDLSKLVLHHKRKKKVATMTCVLPRNQYGILKIKNGLVKSFIEKPRMTEWVNGGFFVFSNKVFDYLSSDCKLETEPFSKMASNGQITAYKHTSFWASMDNYKDYQTLNNIWNEKEAGWKIW